MLAVSSGVSLSSPPPLPEDAWDPVAAEAAVVTLGRLRVTVLSSMLLRVEVSAAAAGNASWDDRATMSVVNRRLEVPPFTVARPDNLTLVVTTDDLTATMSVPSLDTCTRVFPGSDAVSPVRSPTYPNGATVASQAACCALCNNDGFCNAWVFAAPSECWPLAATGGMQTGVSNRVLGDGGPTLSMTVTFTSASGAPATWTYGVNETADTDNLNGTYSALDCYSTPMQCAAEYYGRMGPGLLNRAGWHLLDDTATARLVPIASGAAAGLPTWWSLEPIDTLDLYFQVHFKKKKK